MPADDWSYFYPQVGTYEELISRNGAYAELLRTFVNDEEDEELVDGMFDNHQNISTFRNISY